MIKKSNQGKLWYLGAIGAGLLLFVIILEIIQPAGAPIAWVIRIAALMGYFCIFGAILSSAYMREMRRWFGKPFLKVHHLISITGLVLVTLHPLAVAWRAASLRVFVPAVDSVRSFLALGGRPAWYLIGIAALVAALRKSIGKRWKLLHYLNYLAFWLATVHGIMIGANVQTLLMRGLFIVLALVVLWVTIEKRVLQPRRRRKS